MKHVFIVAIIGGLAFIASATIQGQRSKTFTCDTDNGGLTLPAGFFAGGRPAKLGKPPKPLGPAQRGSFLFRRRGAGGPGPPSPPPLIPSLGGTHGGPQDSRRR